MFPTVANRLARDEVLARLTEHHVEAVYRALGVEHFGPGGPDDWLVSRPWQAERESRPSVTIRKLDGVWNDLARDEAGSIFDAVMKVQGCDFPEALQFVADIAGVRAEPTNGHRMPQQPRRIVATYPYEDESGELLYEVVRYDQKDFSQRRPNGAGGWVWNLDGVRRVLYQLTELLAASPSRWVLITEGEKDADRLRSLGFVATSAAGGANAPWLNEYSETLRGRNVAVLADRDDPGWKRALTVAGALSGVAAVVKVIDFEDLGPRLPKHGPDVSDWLDQGHTADELKQIIQDAPVWTPADDEPAPEEQEPEHEVSETPIPAAPTWPDPPKPEAYYGLAGEIVRALEPETEADPAGLLLNLLTVVGNIIGTRPHWRVGGGRHCLRINSISVGPTSGGRKGTGWSVLKPILRVAAPDWLDRNVKSGLSSGEGLIWAVRDEIRKQEPVKEKGRIIAYEDVVTDPGVEDKRLLVIEQEFASTLKVMSRDSNILSAVIRQAWDDGDLRTLTKNNPAVATGAHISIIGHITKDELLRYLDSTEAGNGFANRFVFACVKRSKLLPEGGQFDEDQITELGERLGKVIADARKIDLITRDEQAAVIWRKVYGPLTEGGVGLLGAVLARAEAQVMRLAAIYAVLDRSDKIRAPHLKAALALWDYIEASTRYIFGDALGDPIADSILCKLRQDGPQARNDIVNLFARNVSRSRIDRALELLLSSGKVSRTLDKDTGGRPKEVWRAR